MKVMGQGILSYYYLKYNKDPHSKRHAGVVIQCIYHVRKITGIMDKSLSACAIYVGMYVFYSSDSLKLNIGYL